MSATETAPEIDVWGWTTQSNPALDTLLEVKRAVLSHPALRQRLEKHLAELKSEEADPLVAGLARWMLAQYHRAYPLLSAARPDNPVLAFARAECCLKSQVSETGGHPMRRPDLAASLLESHPDRATDHRVQALYLEALLFDYDIKKASQALNEASSSFKEGPDGLYVQGRMAEDEGDYAGARRLYEQALQQDPEHRPSLLRLAYQLDLGGEEEQALEAYERLAALHPPEVHSLLNYGILLEDMDRYREAVNCYRRVLAAFPNHSRAQSYLRDALGSLNMFFDEDSERRHDKRNQILRIPISDFELSVRARNCLAKMNIETLGDLVQRTESELLAYKNFGETSLAEIRALLEARGLRLGMNLDEDPLPLSPMGITDAGRPPIPVELPPGVDPGVLSRVLADLELSVRCRKALAQIKAVTVGDLLQHAESELLTIKNFGQTSLNELRSRLAEFGLSLPA